MGTRPTAKQPPASAYRAVGAELSDKTMDEKGIYLHDKYTEIESLVKIGQYIENKILSLKYLLYSKVSLRIPTNAINMNFKM